MELRTLTEKHENEFLATYAIKCCISKGRADFEKEDENRTCFQRDRDRIFFSKNFWKLQYKTQVFITQEGQSYRNRLNHTMQVSVHARTLARILKANEDLCEAISYAHDIGHPPFGHAGEEEIKIISKEKAKFEFEHNIQSLRVVDLLAKRNGKNGLNLCYETREGIARHQTVSDNPKEIPQEFLQSKSPSVETQIVNLADEISFSVHDLYDALNEDLLTFEQIEQLKELEIWQEANERFGQLTHLLINDVLNNSNKNLQNIKSIDEVRRNEVLCDFSPEKRTEITKLQKFLLINVYKNPVTSLSDKKGRKIIRDLFNVFWEEPKLLPANELKRLDSEDKVRVIIDFISSCTDTDAINIHRDYCDLNKKVIF